MKKAITDRSENADQKSKDELRNCLLAQKSALIAELTRATANQFNNTMMAITGHVELELKKANGKDKLRLEQLLANATRAAAMIQKLLDASRERTSAPRNMEVDSVITEVRELLKQLLGDRIELELNLHAGSGMIRADRVEFEQVLLSLALIARDAMGTAGTLNVSTDQKDLDRKTIRTKGGAAAGRYLIVTIEDCSGAYVSKKKDGSTSKLAQTARVNLSLAVTRLIMRESQGFVHFNGDTAGARSFQLFFPVAEAQTAGNYASGLPRNFPTSRTILLVEDDDSVRIPSAEFLMMEGFKVLQARTGDEALRVIEQSRSALDVLVTDIFMPQMSGHEVAAKLLKQYPTLKVMYISGDTSESASGANKIAEDAILQKPFRLEKLRDKIHELLGE